MVGGIVVVWNVGYCGKHIAIRCCRLAKGRSSESGYFLEYWWGLFGQGYGPRVISPQKI